MNNQHCPHGHYWHACGDPKCAMQDDIDMSEKIYAMDYEDDARLVRLERKVDAILKYLMEKNTDA